MPPAQPMFGSSQRTISQWIESKNFPQALASDSIQDVLDKYRMITNTLATEMRAVSALTGEINKRFWGDIMNLLEKFLEKKTKVYDRLSMTSLIQSSKEEIFTVTTEYRITVDELQRWLQITLQEEEDYTMARRISQLMMDKIPMSQDLVDQYNLCYKNVEQHIGKTTRFVLPVQG